MSVGRGAIAPEMALATMRACRGSLSALRSADPTSIVAFRWCIVLSASLGSNVVGVGVTAAGVGPLEFKAGSSSVNEAPTAELIRPATGFIVSSLILSLKMVCPRK